VDLENGQAGETDIIGSVTNFLSWDEFVGIEGVVGTHGPDLLRGSTAGNYLEGGGGGDKIEGRGGADDLVGGDGRDVLIGGEDADTLTGGDGRDLFVFQSTEDSNGSYDTITDVARST
jgi:Ca2+-binding RTX toxin-like protein